VYRGLHRRDPQPKATQNGHHAVWEVSHKCWFSHN
jgi:hypothetical protein